MGGLSVEAVTLGLGAVLLVTMTVTLAARHRLTTGGEASARNLTLYEVAMLAGGPSRVSDTALAYLTWSGMVEVRESTDRLARLVGGAAVADIHPIETSVLSRIDPFGTRPQAAMGSGRDAARRFIDGLDGLLIDPRRQLTMTAGVGTGAGLVVAGALWWIAESSSTLGFVPLLALVAVVYWGWWLAGGRPRLSGSGLKTLERIRGRYDEDLQVAAIGVTSLPVERAMHVIALYGRDALTGGLSGLRKVMTGNPPPPIAVRSSLVR